jgi:hypothetical protein
MAYTRGAANKGTRSFIPIQFATKLLAKLDKTCVAMDCVNTDYEGEISEFGDLVTIPELGDISINDWTVDGTITYQTTTESSTDLVIDQMKYYAYKVDYVDITQTNIDVINGYAERAAIGMRNTVDTHLLTNMTAAVPSDNTMGAPITGSVIQLTAENILSVYTDLYTLLEESDVFSTTDQRPWTIATPQVKALMAKSNQLRPTDLGDESVRSLVVGEFAGFDVKVTTNLALTAASSGTDDYFPLIGGVNFAHSFALQTFMEEEIAPLQTTFGKGRRGLALYGSKAIRPQGLVKFYGKV